MREILRLKKTNCKNCHKCIRNCSVKSIRFTAGQAHIVEEECILCGRCFAVCPQNAKVIASDLEKVKVLLQRSRSFIILYACQQHEFHAGRCHGKFQFKIACPYCALFYIID